MSEYHYYEFCSLNKPLSKEARVKMNALSSRANVGTHTVAYVYQYGNFRGKRYELLLKYFNIFFYISNFGIIELMFKYSKEEVDVTVLKKYQIKGVIEIKEHLPYVVVTIRLHNEEGLGWTEGEGILPELLPLYDEISAKNYHFLTLTAAIQDELSGQNTNALKTFLSKKNGSLTDSENLFLGCLGISAEVMV